VYTFDVVLQKTLYSPYRGLNFYFVCVSAVAQALK